MPFPGFFQEQGFSSLHILFFPAAIAGCSLPVIVGCCIKSTMLRTDDFQLSRVSLINRLTIVISITVYFPGAFNEIGSVDEWSAAAMNSEILLLRLSAFFLVAHLGQP
jgi:hypothetical protein